MRLISLLLLSLLPVLTGCGEDEFQDLQEFVKNSGADLRGKIEAPPEVKPYEPFAYDNSSGLADPFKPRSQTRSPARLGSNQPDMERRKEDLEEFPLDGLKMVGYLFIRNSPSATISAPDGKLHQVKIGSYMGQNFGRVISISETEIKLKEMVQDSTGDWSERISSLQLIE